jgi:hypothetical protein
MTRKLFYTCPIEAAYMAKNFGVKFHSFSTNIEDNYHYETAEEILEYFNPINYTVSSDTLSIFEARDGDVVIGQWGDRPESFFFFDEGEKNQSRLKVKKIILRKDKSFIMPTEEK